MNTKVFQRATGRRKEAVARVRVLSGTGKREVNGKTFENYFQNPTILMIIDQPFQILENSDQYDVMANVKGGGLSGQAEAIQLGISRSLVSFNEDFKRPLRTGGFLTRDSRVVQRKMYGRAKARKRFQFSKR